MKMGGRSDTEAEAALGAGACGIALLIVSTLYTPGLPEPTRLHPRRRGRGDELLQPPRAMWSYRAASDSAARTR
jgi:hypothetical protein